MSLKVWQIITTVRQNNNSAQETADYLEIPVESVGDAMQYYERHMDEIDSEIPEAEDIAHEARDRWQAEN